MSLEDDCLRFDAAAYAQATWRLKTAPLTLTDGDFDQLAIVSTALERGARETQRQAQLAFVHAHPPRKGRR